MLTKDDLQAIGNLIEYQLSAKIGALETRFENFAISVKQQFDTIDTRFDSLETKIDGVEGKLDGKADKLDIARLEGYLLSKGNRIDRLEDDMRLVKTKLHLI